MASSSILFMENCFPTFPRGYVPTHFLFYNLSGSEYVSSYFFLTFIVLYTFEQYRFSNVKCMSTYYVCGDISNDKFETMCVIKYNQSMDMILSTKYYIPQNLGSNKKYASFSTKNCN